MTPPTPTPLERLMSRTIQYPDGCWIWIGPLTNGYGRMSFQNQDMNAHRLMFILTYGPVASKLDVDHICRNRACVNPEHLRLMTRGENVRAGESISSQNRKKQSCPYGHSFAGLNKRGDRFCRTCKQKRDRDRYAREVKA